MATRIRYVLDAHAIIWFLEDNPKLGSQAKAILNNSGAALFLPAIALAEACWVVQDGRTAIPSTGDLLRSVRSDPRVQVVALDVAVIERSNSLQAIREMHDKQIVATTLLMAEQGDPVAILTRDANITASGLVPVIW